MDVSRDLVRMCKEAIELQNLRPVGKPYVEGDFYVTNYEGEEEIEFKVATLCTCTLKEEPITRRRQESDIWIPRWDQLGGMVRFSKGNSKNFFGYLSSASYNLAGLAKNRNFFDTPDKHLLSFVMKESFNKFWDLDVEKWLSSESTNEDNTIKYYHEGKWIEKDLNDTI